MNNALPLSVTVPALHREAAPRHAAAPSVFARLLMAVTALFVSRDDPAALGYASVKYGGERD